MKSWPRFLGRRLGRFAALLASLALVIGAVGCASRRPVPVVIEHQVTPVATNDSRGGIRLKLVTYNIWGLPSWMTGARRGRYPQIAHELERLQPDLILLQEAWTGAARKAAPTNTPWAVARAAGQHTFFQQNGLMVLSKFPILGGEFYPFSRAAYPDRFVNKGALKVTIQLPGGEVLNVWNVHMQDKGSADLRLSQVRELVAHVQTAEDGQVADLVGGDFNCTPDSGLWREMVNSLGPTVQQLAGTEPFVTWDGLSEKPGSGVTIDHIFIRARTTFQDLRASQHVVFTAASKAQRLSDHFGVEAVVNLAPAPSLARAGGRSVEGSSLSPVAAGASAYAGGD